MAERERRRRKKKDEDSEGAEGAEGAEGGRRQERNWSNLPDLVLSSILIRLGYDSQVKVQAQARAIKALRPLMDFFAFSGVCRPWRSVAIATKREYMASLPPLLLRREPNYGSHSRYRPCLYSLIVVPRMEMSAKVQLPPLEDMRGFGFSYGYLIMRDKPSDKPLLLNLFTGEAIWFPKLRSTNNDRYYFAFLTAPPSSPDSVLVLFGSHPSRALLYCRPGDVSWKKRPKVVLGGGKRIFTRAVVVNGIVYVLSTEGELMVISRFFPQLEMDKLFVKGFPGLKVKYYKFGMNATWISQLAESGGELLLIQAVKRTGGSSYSGISVYRLDFPKLEWVKKENLGECSLFVSYNGCIMSCTSPTKWGCRGNSIYLAYRKLNDWTVPDWTALPLNSNDCNFDLDSYRLDIHPPLWVFPSQCF